MPSIVKLKEELQGVRLRGCEAARLRRLLREMEFRRFCVAWAEGLGPKDPACIVIRYMLARI
jgi:hypothetical protein